MTVTGGRGTDSDSGDKVSFLLGLRVLFLNVLSQTSLLGGPLLPPSCSCCLLPDPELT